MKYVYVLRSVGRPKKTYIGQTNDLKRRLPDHNSDCCAYTSRFMPWELVYFEISENAFQREKQIKKWSKAKKDALIAGNLDKLKLLSIKNAYR